MAYIGTQPKDVRSFGRAKFDFTATQGQTAFTGADDDSKTLGFTDGQIEVYVNGILMDDSDFTTSNGNTVTLASAANLNDIISIVALQTDIPNSDYVPTSGGTFTGNVQFDGSFTSKGIDDNADATAVTIDSLENVMVGKTSAGIANTGSEFSSTGRAFFTYDGGGPLQLNRKTSDGDIIELHKDGTEVGSVGIQSTGFYIDGEGGHAGIRFAGNELSPRDNGADADGVVSLGESDKRWKDLYLSGGAYIGGTGNANKLDDYEEGTWTAALDGITIASQFCRYIKVGTLVHVGAQIAIPVTGSGNNAMIGGFPFTTLNSDASRAGIVISWHNVPSSNGLQFLLSDNATNGFFYIGSSIKSYANMSGATVYFGGTYIAA